MPIVWEAGRAPRPDWTGAEYLVPTGIRSPDRPARNESLYWLSYPAPDMSAEYVYEMRVAKDQLQYRLISSAEISSTDTVRALCDIQMAVPTWREKHHWNLISAFHSL